MKTFKQKYKRLPGRSKPLFAIASSNRQRLYLGEDHVLVVNPGAYSEESYRIALADIQTLATSKTYGWYVGLILPIALGIWIPISILVFLDSFQPEELMFSIGLSAFLLLPFIVVFLVNLFLGPTCKTILGTAVKQHDLTCLRRKRSADKAIAMIAQAAYSPQGTFSPPETPVQETVDTDEEVSAER